MSKLDELIAELCPDGVEYVKLGDVIKLEKGKQLNKEFLTEQGKYPAYNGGVTHSGFTDKYNYDENKIIISQGGASAGFVNFVKTKFWANAHCYVVLPIEHYINNRYAYHFIKSKQTKLMDKQHGAGIPALRSSEINNLKIPLPPLPVQQEIVRILDNFTELTAELEAELEARTKQYEYYKNSLMNFDSEVVEFYKVSEIGNIYGGLSGKSKADFENGNKKYITYKNIYNNINVQLDVDDLVSIKDNEKQNKIMFGDILFTGSSETLEDSGFSSVVTEEVKEDTYLNSFSFALRLNNPDILLPNFSKHLFRSKIMRDQIIKCANGVTRYNMSKKMFNNILVPIPPLEEQERIVSILDKFSALVSDIKEGLPAEIELRRKQYEYYRDKLLTFKKLEV